MPQNTGYWTGIGGVSNSLIQNGTGQQTDANGNITKDGNLWWEVVSSGYSDGADLMTQSGSTITVPEGAAMGLETEWDLTDSTSTDWAFYFSWADQSSDTYWPFYWYAPRSDPAWSNWLPTTGEFIVEPPVVRVLVNGQWQTEATNMVDFGNLNSPVDESEVSGVKLGHLALQQQPRLQPFIRPNVFCDGVSVQQQRRNVLSDEPRSRECG